MSAQVLCRAAVHTQVDVFVVLMVAGLGGKGVSWGTDDSD